MAQDHSQNKQCSPSFTVRVVVKPDRGGCSIVQPRYLCRVMLGTVQVKKKNPVIRFQKTEKKL